MARVRKVKLKNKPQSNKDVAVRLTQKVADESIRSIHRQSNRGHRATGLVYRNITNRNTFGPG